MSKNRLGGKIMGDHSFDQRSQQRADPALSEGVSRTAEMEQRACPHVRPRVAVTKAIRFAACRKTKALAACTRSDSEATSKASIGQRRFGSPLSPPSPPQGTDLGKTESPLYGRVICDSGSNEPIYGMVVAVQANYYQVKLDTTPEAAKSSEEIDSGQFLLCTRRTRLKKIGQKVMVGDRVLVEEPDWQAARGAIGAVLPRSTELHRPPVANASQILLVFALAEPLLDPWQLSRFLVKAESTSLELSLCLNKSDLISLRQQEQWQRRLAAWGYQASFISVSQPSGIDELKQRLQGKITVVAGPSGVGKSSLIDFLIPEANLRVGEVSGKLQRGRHTTRHVELFELPGGGLLADTPGFNQPDLNCLPSQLALYFPEVRAKLQDQSCQFNNCLHRDEPGCVVRGNWERYEYYLDFLTQVIVQAAEVQQQPTRESNLKLTIKKAGKSQYEPKLQTKKYRRTSRKTRQQNLQDIYEQQLEEEIEDRF